MGEVHRAGMGLCELDQVLHAFCGDLRIDDENERVLGNVADVHEVLLRIEAQIGQGDRHHREPGRRPCQRVAVRCGAGELAEGDRSARARLILHDDDLPEILRHVPRQDANQNVGAAARRKRYDHGDRARRIRLRQHGARTGNGRSAEQCYERAPVHAAHAILSPGRHHCSFRLAALIAMSNCACSRAI